MIAAVVTSAAKQQHNQHDDQQERHRFEIYFNWLGRTAIGYLSFTVTWIAEGTDGATPVLL